MFDTGVGGLTVLAELRKVLPAAPVILASDYAGIPYGKKTEAEVAARVAGLLGRMSERFEPRLACIACNTASTIALGMVREVLEIPIVGTVPAIKPAALSSESGVIGMLGTAATVRQPYVDNLEREFVQDGTLLRYAAPDLVDEAENKLRGKPVDLDIIAAAFGGLAALDPDRRVDRIVLGCTHFPLLEDELRMVAGSNFGYSEKLQFIDGAAGIARRVATLLEGQEFAANAVSRAVTTGPLEAFEELKGVFSAQAIDHIERF
ncbi:MAG: glutamate racemase [Erythrobacter sp.]